MRYFFVVFLILFICGEVLMCQGLLVFSYDGRGNQLKKSVRDVNVIVGGSDKSDVLYRDSLLDPYLTDGLLSKSSVGVFPNPVENDLVIRVSRYVESESLLVNYRLYNFSGFMNLSGSFIGLSSKSIDVSFLDVGFYILVVNYGDKEERVVIIKSGG